MKENVSELPRITEGGLSIDDRGQISFVNDFRFEGVKRFYTVINHRVGFVRAWHAHRNEAKHVFVVRGTVLFGAVAIDNWETPSKSAQVHKYILSEKKPAILHIPAGYANGFMSLTEGAQVVFFSTATNEETRNDDVRYDARYWDLWKIVER